MVKYVALDQTFAALSDPIRRTMVEQLSRGEATVGELAAPHRISLPAVLKHVRTLERAGLVRARKEGRTRTCQLAPEPLAQASQWLAHYRRFWQGQLDSLDRYLRSTSNSEPTWTPPPRTSPSKSDAPTRPRRRASSKRGPKRKG